MVITQHSRKRLMERGIKLIDVCNAINSRMIIKEYPNDRPFPSCLILGKSNNIDLHVCASIDGDFLYIITAYIPDPQKWETNLKTRKEEAK